MIALANTQRPTDKVVQDAVSQTFRVGSDGWFYPNLEGTPLARVMVANGEFYVERKRRPASEWVRVVATRTHEFSAEAFAVWQRHWPLVA